MRNLYRKIFYGATLAGLFLLAVGLFWQTLSPTVGYIEVVPGESTITIEKYGYVSHSVDNYAITYFFLPSYIDISRINYEKSDLKIFNSDGSLWEDPVKNEIQEVLVQDVTGELIPWKIGLFQSDNLYTIELTSQDTPLEDVLREEKTLFEMEIRSPEGELTFSDIVLLKGRGNTTWENHIKKPYEIKLDHKTPLCEMESADRWVLLANAFDDTKMRNKLIYDLSIALGMENAVESDWVDLYADGEYLGNYLLCQDPKTGIDKLDQRMLQKQNAVLFDDPEEIETDNVRGFDYDTSSLDMSGAYLLKIGYLYKMKGEFITENERRYGIAYPDNPSVMEAEYIRSVMGNVEDSIFGNNGGIPDSIDKYSFARRYLVEELAMDRDGPTESYYFYKKKTDDRLYAGPCWDYDHAMASADDERGIFNQDYTSECFPPSSMDGTLISDDEYMAYVKSVFYEYRKCFEDLYSIRIGEYYSRIKDSLNMDRAKWEGVEEQIGVFSGRYKSLENNIRFLRYFIYNRLVFMSNYYDVAINLHPMDTDNDNNHTLTFWFDDGRVEERIVPDGALLSTSDIPMYDEERFSGWEFGDGFIFSQYIPVYEDISLRLKKLKELPK